MSKILEATNGLLEIGLGRDVVPLEHLARAMAAHLHHYGLWNAGAARLRDRRFNGYIVNDPTCNIYPGNTCTNTGYYMQRCSQQDCKWKFDIDVHYDIKIGFPEQQDPAARDPEGQTLWAHEHRHLKEVIEKLDESLLNQLIPTEGFLTRGACEAGRVSARIRLDEDLNDVTNVGWHK